MDFAAEYRAKRATAADIAGTVVSGMSIMSDIALSAPQALLTAIGERVMRSGVTDVKLYTSLDLFPLACYADPERAFPKIRGISWFSSAGARSAVNEGYADIIPQTYRNSPRIMLEHYAFDACVAAVSPMDKHGYFSFGATASTVDVLMKKSKRIFLEINPNMPRAVNGPLIHISQVDALCESELPLATLPAAPIDSVSRTIGDMIAAEIPDGATLQLGIGAIPEAVGQALKDKRHLGIHTEMFTSSMVDLIECGAVDNSRKPIHTGRSVATFALGSQKMYDYLDDNPAVELLPVAQVNDPAVIARHDDFMSVNSAIEIDFFGQSSAESIGTRHMSGSGGQVDFVLGATMSKGGKSFLAFPSTARGGTVSKIRPTLTPGAVVTTGKNDVDYVVTEYGMAHLRGMTLSQRAKALIAIAHPKFRAELTYAAKKQNIMI